MLYNRSGMDFDATFKAFFNELFRNQPKYEPPKRKCAVCSTLMLPVAAGVNQFQYYEIRRKTGIPTNFKFVCCDLCAVDYEDKYLPRRYLFLESGYVYLMRAEWGYKIGESEDPERRRRTLQSKYKKPIELLHTIKAPHSIGAEKFFQYRYSDLQIDLGNSEREWFNLSEREIKYITSFTAIEAWRPDGKPGTVIAKLSWKS